MDENFREEEGGLPLLFLSRDESCALYRMDVPGALETYVASTPGTRRICNDPTCAGIAYTRLLQGACTEVLRRLSTHLVERETVVVNILRGGLNYGLRDALADAFGWNAHATSFISAQRANDDDGSGDWHITENAYRKIYFPPRASFVIGDVVATGTSLRYGLQELLRTAREAGTDLRNIVFFTFGGMKAREILEEVDAQCRAAFPHYERTQLFFLEGAFTVPDERTPLRIRLPGTDLLRLRATMAPEFIESQYEAPSYPIERCVIYDAGSRAFWLPDFVEDVIGYWRQTLGFAERGVTFRELLAERFPRLDADRFGDVDLRALCRERLALLEKTFPR